MGGGLKLKVEDEDSNWFLGKNVGLLFQVLSLIQGERTLSASLRLQLPLLLSHLCVFFSSQLALGLASIPLDPKQWNLAVSPAVLLYNIVYSCFRFSAKAEQGCSSLRLNSLSWEGFFFFFNWKGVFKVSSFQPQTRCNNALFLLRHQMRDKDHSRHLLPTVWGFFS